MSNDNVSKSEEQKIAELAMVFERLGADRPELWARSEIQDNIPQLGRFLFLHTAWSYLLQEDDTSWIDKQIRASEGRLIFLEPVWVRL